MKTAFKIEVEIDLTINPIDVIHVWHDVEVCVNHHIEKGYGEDADGNRGIEYRKIDAIEILSVVPFVKITESIKYHIERVAIEQLERHI